MSIAKIKNYARRLLDKRLLVVLLVLLALGGILYFIAPQKEAVQVSAPNCEALINSARPPVYEKPADLYKEFRSAESFCLNTPTTLEGRYQKVRYLVSLAKVAYAAGDKQSAYAYAHKASDEYSALSDKEKQGLPDGQSVGIAVITLLNREKGQ